MTHRHPGLHKATTERLNDQNFHWPASLTREVGGVLVTRQVRALARGRGLFYLEPGLEPADPFRAE